MHMPVVVRVTNRLRPENPCRSATRHVDPCANDPNRRSFLVEIETLEDLLAIVEENAVAVLVPPSVRTGRRWELHLNGVPTGSMAKPVLAD
jgi:hypothetical protein